MPVSKQNQQQSSSTPALLNELIALHKALKPAPTDGQNSRLSDRFLLPPFTVLDARQGYWQNRKRMWLDLGIQSELGRGDQATMTNSSDRAMELAGGFSERHGRKADSIPGGGGGPNSKHRLFSQEMADRQRKRLAKAFNIGLNGDKSNDWTTQDSHGSGTSIFDPVICELVYRWFAPQGGSVLDPFAGGSVRGVVAGRLGREYVGIELSERQVEANRVQWQRIGVRKESQSRPTPSMMPPPVVERVEVEGASGATSIRVVRDDLLLGGTKRRALSTWLLRLAAETDKSEFVYAGPAYGFAQVALALVCRDLGFRAHLFVPERKQLHTRSATAQEVGATVTQVPAGRLNVLEARAKEYAERNGAVLLPFGLHAAEFIQHLAEVIRDTNENPNEAWCVGGSGVLALAMREAWPDCKLNVVQIGTGRTDLPPGATIYRAPESFEEDALYPPPFPSCSNYDAKAWRFIRAHAQDGSLFWNVAADLEPSLEEEKDQVSSECDTSVAWYTGDSRVVLPTLKEEGAQFDLVFSCPPYADLERYSDDPRDLSTMRYEEFLEEYTKIIVESCSLLKDNRFACFVVGDVRNRSTGYYYNFVGDTVRAFQAAGLELYNDAVLVTSVGSLPIRVGAQFVQSRKLGKTHQNVLVFVKGDPRRATEACGDIDVDDLEMPACTLGSIALCTKDVRDTIAVSHLTNRDSEVSLLNLPDREAYLLSDVVRGRKIETGEAVPRAWLGTHNGWKRLSDRDRLMYVAGDKAYLSRDIFPEAPTPPAVRPEVKRMRD